MYSLKLLGVTIDNKLNFNKHKITALKKTSQRIGVLWRLKNLVPTSAKLQLTGQYIKLCFFPNKKIVSICRVYISAFICKENCHALWQKEGKLSKPIQVFDGNKIIVRKCSSIRSISRMKGEEEACILQLRRHVHCSELSGLQTFQYFSQFCPYKYIF